jgi:hypothetical protein
MLDAEVVNGKCEGGAPSGVPPYSGSERHGCISVRCQMFFQLLVCEYTGFLEAIHSFLNFKVCIALGVKVGVG